MDEAPTKYAFIALDGSGRRSRGEMAASDEGAVFGALRADGLMPISIRPMRSQMGRLRLSAVLPMLARSTASSLSDRAIAELLANLAALLKAGADIRSALSILGAATAPPKVQAFCKSLSSAISSGSGVDQALAPLLTTNQQYIAALAAAGQASGDLAGGIGRAASILETRIKLKDQLVSALSYPVFVFASAVGALSVILLFIVPALAPIAEDTGTAPPLTLAIMISASELLRTNLGSLSGIISASTVIILLAARFGLLAKPLDLVAMHGPTAKTSSSLVYGGFAIALGSLLSAGAPMTDALRLATRTVRSPSAAHELERLAQSVRQGETLSSALQTIKGAPPVISRLTSVGEASGSMGQMLVRAGELEERRAVRRIETTGQILGPILIVLLGAMIGLLMAGLLSGVSQLGNAALN